MFRFSFSKKPKNFVDIEPQEVLLDKLSKQKEEEMDISERKFETPLSRKALWLFWIFYFISLFLIIGKSIQLQVIQAKTLSSLSDRNRFIARSIEANRGVIYDSKGVQLVFNQPQFNLILSPRSLPKDQGKREKILKEVSSITKIDFSKLEKLSQSKEYKILVLQNLDRHILIWLQTKIISGSLPGFEIEKKFYRSYKSGPIFAHIIGFKRNNGESWGIEKSYDNVLKEDPGKILIEKDAFSRIIKEKIVYGPKSGKSLVLYLDSGLQKKITDELNKELSKIGAKKAAAVAIDPNTGGILSLVSIPSFDNNKFSQGITPAEWEKISKNPLKPLFNRAISAQLPTGSTIKPLVASALLQEKIISPEKKIFCPLSISVSNPWHPDHPYVFKDWTFHGWTDLRKAIAESCNTYFYILGGGYKNIKGLGVEKIKKYLKLFGWGEKTGIDLPGEEKGFIPDPAWKKNYFKTYQQQIWRVGDTYNLSIGQGFLSATPLQVAVATAAIANGGKVLQPHVVKQIVDNSEGSIKVLEETKPKVIREGFISPKNLQVVREGMRQAVTSSHTASRELDDLSVKVASKTGTAEIARKGYYHHWVTIFAPYDHPKIVLTIVIEDVNRFSSTTVPVAKDVLKWYFSSD